jgi:hypothetical protein
VEVPAEGATAESDQKAKAEAQAANQQKKPRSTQQREVQRPPPAAEQPRFRSPFGFLFGR